MLQLDVQISIPATLRERTTGLCGIYDDDHKNDWYGRDIVEHDEDGFATFVKSWVDESIAGLLSLPYIRNRTLDSAMN
jgi:hypothetical protein